jgi:hypothetical protein
VKGTARNMAFSPGDHLKQMRAQNAGTEKKNQNIVTYYGVTIDRVFDWILDLFAGHGSRAV